MEDEGVWAPETEVPSGVQGHSEAPQKLQVKCSLILRLCRPCFCTSFVCICILYTICSRKHPGFFFRLLVIARHEVCCGCYLKSGGYTPGDLDKSQDWRFGIITVFII